MSNLYVGDVASDLLVNDIITSRGQKLVLTRRGSQLAKRAAALGVSVLEINSLNKAVATEERDLQFTPLALPGSLDEIAIGSFPVWKSLSMDRLRFWFDPRAESIIERLKTINISSLTIGFSMGEAYPWIAAAYAKEQKIKVKAVKVSSFMSQPVLDFLESGMCPVDELIVATARERDFLKKRLVAARVKMTVKANPFFQSNKEVNRRRADNSEGIVEGTVGVLFAPEDDWKFLLALPQIQYQEKLYLCVLNNRDWVSLASSHPYLLLQSDIQIADASVLAICETVYLPRHMEHLEKTIPANSQVRYYDVANEAGAAIFLEAK